MKPSETTIPLWGDETRKAIENFPVSGSPMPIPVIRWLARIKAIAAEVNAELGLLDEDRAARISVAASAVAAGDHDDQFPVDVFQTGSGTSTNMNANEVIAALAGPDVHPNDHVNLGQSSNDIIPTAVHLAVSDAIETELLPAIEGLAVALGIQATDLVDVVTVGRTHLMDAVPITLGQRFAGYETQMRHGSARVRAVQERVAQVPLGGTAVGTGLNTHPQFGARVRARLHDLTGVRVAAPTDPFEAQGARDALVEASAALDVLAVSLMKIANDLRWMASGPRTGLAEIRLPALQKGSSIMPGKVNPVICEVVLQVGAQVIGNHTTITVAGMHGNFELNAMVPVIARNLLESIELLTNSIRLFDERCVRGIQADEDTCRDHANQTLASATALNPVIGYDLASRIVEQADETGRSLREVALELGVDAAVIDAALDPIALAHPHRSR